MNNCTNLAPVTDQANSKPQRVLIVEDDPLLGHELTQLINQQSDFEVHGWAETCTAGQALVAQDHDVLIVDVGLPDGSGIDVLRRQKSLHQDVKALVMTVFEDQVTTAQAIDAGADGYVLKTDPEFLTRLRQVVAHKHPFDPAVTGYLVEAARKQEQQSQCALSLEVDLTARELETLEGLARGLTYAEIARGMAISPNTVADYIKGIYRKLGVRSRSAAVYTGVQLGLITF